MPACPIRLGSGGAMSTKLLVLLTSSKRSRVVTALVFGTFVLVCVLRLNSTTARIFSRPSISSASTLTPIGIPDYGGPRFNIFGIPDFADAIEVATLEIKIKEDNPKSKGGGSKEPLSNAPAKFSTSETTPEDTLNTRRDAASTSPPTLSTLQQQLPIALPQFYPHRLDGPDFNIADLEHPPAGVPPATITLELPSKPAPQPDASSLIFGVATTLDRLPSTLRSFRHWAANTHAHFVILHEPHNTKLRPGEPTAAEVITMYREAGIENLDMIEQDAGWVERFVGLLNVTHRVMERTPSAKWAVLIDDDTFFFDLQVVLSRLQKYDYRAEWYVGALSENKWNINNGGLYAVGGAGVFISKGLLDTLAPHAGTCFPHSDKPTTLGGDMLVGLCIHRWTTTKLTLEHGLRQLDIHGDPSGFYEALREQPLSVHHWKSWHQVDMPTVAAVAAKCGRECVLRNYKFQDGWQMSNGFSIVRYGYKESYLAEQHPLAMEHTWKGTIWDIEDSWQYSLAPLKERDGRKVQYLNEKTLVNDDGTVTIFYVRREKGVGRGLIRVVWK